MAFFSRKTSPSQIQRLPSVLINQIAAGEVVERPASVIKELVENSLDAGATRIEIELLEGGIQSIKIIDDGFGIPKDQLALALERHATSKIQSEKDLTAIYTYGFRGEALAAISSVSEFEIKSRQKDLDVGHLLKSNHGEVEQELRPVGMPVGTQITVSKLFGKLPARQKYLRAAQTEYSHAARMVKEIALGVPEVSFRLSHQGKVVLNYPAQSRLNRFIETQSPSWEPIYLSEETEGISFEGYLSPPDHIQDRGDLFVFINARPVRHRLFASAIRNAFTEVLGPHHEPSGVVYLDIRPDWIDVNVHPQKWEVRLLRQERVYAWLVNYTRKILSGLTNTTAAEVNLPDLSSPTASGVAAQTTESHYRYIGNYRTKYILAEDRRGLVLFDPRAVHENLLYESFRKNVPTQDLASPAVVALPSTVEVFTKALAVLGKCGFNTETFGDKEVLLKTAPAFCEPSEAAQIFLTLLQRHPTEKDRVLAELTRFAAVDPKAALTQAQAETLLSALKDGASESWTCPHGRPILLRLNTHKFTEGSST